MTCCLPFVTNTVTKKLHLLMVFTSKKRPAPAQGGPKSKKLHVDSDKKKRSRPITQPLHAQDLNSESEENLGDDIDLDEDESDEHREEDGDDSAMQVDSRTNEDKIPRDPNGLSTHKFEEAKLSFC